MTTQHAIVAFPSLDVADQIEAVRRRFDPLASLLAAHVTIVFPTTAVASVTELVAHVTRTVAGVRPFETTLASVSADSDGYIMLDATRGADRFMDLHARLYTGMLAARLSRVHTYRPHVTVGHCANPQDAAFAADVVRRELPRPVVGLVTELAVFEIDPIGQGGVVATIGLGSGPAR